MKRKPPVGDFVIGGGVVTWERYRAEDFSAISGARRRQIRKVRRAPVAMLH